METEQNSLIQELKNFTGTTQYFKHFTGLLFTDGVKYLADKVGCYWLIDVIASYQYKLKNISFQLWEIKVNSDKTAIVSIREDTNTPILIKQELIYTDFPLSEFKFYCIDGVLLLPSEY